MPSVLITLKQNLKDNSEHPALVVPPAIVYLALRFVERNQKGNYFRETQFAGRSVPVSSIGWLWSNDVPNVPGTSYAVSEPDTHFRWLSPSVAKGRKCTLGYPFPSTVCIE